MVEEGQAARKGEVASREKERESESWGLSARPLSLPLLIGRDAFSFPRKTRPRRVTTPRWLSLPRGLKAGESRAFPLVSHQQVWLIMRRLLPRREKREREREKRRRKEVGARLLTLERPDVLMSRRSDIFRRERWRTVCCRRMISELETLIFFRIPNFRDNYIVSIIF